MSLYSFSLSPEHNLNPCSPLEDQSVGFNNIKWWLQPLTSTSLSKGGETTVASKHAKNMKGPV